MPLTGPRTFFNDPFHFNYIFCSKGKKRTEKTAPGSIRGYDLRVDDDFQAVGVEDPADVHVELVELVDGPRRPHVPQHAVV